MRLDATRMIWPYVLPDATTSSINEYGLSALSVIEIAGGPDIV